jgi:polyhydroxybutyrate depolymerase
VPPDYTGGTRVRLVIALHGLGGSPEGLRDMTGLTAATDSAGGIVVFPEGTGREPGWNIDKLTVGPDDSAFLLALIESLDARVCIAPRPLVTGYSNGGGMALRFACDAPDRVGVVAPVAATFPSCASEVPLIAFHGSADLVVPYEGGAAPGASRTLPPVHRAASEWARTLGCDGLPTISHPAAGIELSTYGNCRLGAAVLYTVLDGGHTWPGAAIELDPGIAGRTTRSISASELMLEFYVSHVE